MTNIPDFRTATSTLSGGPAALTGDLTGDNPSAIGQPSQAAFIALTQVLPSPSPSPTVSPTFTKSPAESLTPTTTTTPTAIFTPTATAIPTLPAQHDVPTFAVRHQLLALDCEAAAATQWAGYFGVKIKELDFQQALPRSDNPDYGFVGSVNDPWGNVPPHGYGVYAGPVAALLNADGVLAAAIKGYTLDQLEAKIAGNVPVIAWVTGNVTPGTPYKYIDLQGRTTVVAAFEHVIIVSGYTLSTIRYISEGVYYTTTIQAFLKSWSVLGKMVVVTP